MYVPLINALIFYLLPSLFPQVSSTLQPHWCHSITPFCHIDGIVEVTMFGGSTDLWVGSEEKQSKLADTTLLQFCKCMNMLLQDSAYTCMWHHSIFFQKNKQALLTIIVQ